MDLFLKNNDQQVLIGTDLVFDPELEHLYGEHHVEAIYYSVLKNEKWGNVVYEIH